MCSSRRRISQVESEPESLLRKYGDLDGKLYLLDVLRQKDAGLGLSLSGNADPNFMSVYICGIRTGSAVDKDGRLAVGDELLEVNGHVLQGRSHLNAAPIIGQCQTNAVKFVLHRADTNLSKMAVRTCAPAFAKHKPSVPEDVMELSRITPNGRPVTGRKLSKPLESTELPNGQVPVQSKRSSKFKEVHPVYGDVYIISIEKGDQGLGFAIMEGSFSDEPGIYVKHVTPESKAAEEGTLQMGDRLISINDKDVAEESYDVVLDCLRSCSGLVTMLIGRQPSNSSRRSSAAIPPSPTPSPLLKEEPETAADPAPADAPRKVSLPTTPSVPTPEPVKKTSPVPVRAKKDDKELMTCPVVPGEETEIVIEKNRAGLGISIVGGRDTLLGIIIIHEVYPDGAAARDGRLWAGDQVLEVNDVDLRSVEHELAIQTLRQSGNRVHMLVFRDEKPLEEKDLYDILTLDFMKKASKGLGISIVGRKNDAGVYVSEVIKGGVAETDGRIRSGDQILEVNGTDMRAATQEHVATVLKSTVGKVALTVGRLKARAASPRPVRNLPRSNTGEILSSQ